MSITYEITDAGHAALDALARVDAATAQMDAQDRSGQLYAASAADHELADDNVAEHC